MFLVSSKENVIGAPLTFTLKDYALLNCFDENNEIYVILGVDEGIFHEFERVRIGLSLVESKQLHMHGAENGRIKTYCIAKNIINCLGIRFRRMMGAFIVRSN